MPLEHGARALARPEVARVAGELHPLILAVFVRLDERRPLHHAPEFAPPRGLKREGKGKSSSASETTRVDFKDADARNHNIKIAIRDGDRSRSLRA